MKLFKKFVCVGTTPIEKRCSYPPLMSFHWCWSLVSGAVAKLWLASRGNGEIAFGKLIYKCLKFFLTVYVICCFYQIL